MYATVNGERREVESGVTVAELLRNLKLEGPGIAVAVNDRVVRTSTFDEHRLSEGDVIEIIRAVAGG